MVWAGSVNPFNIPADHAESHRDVMYVAAKARVIFFKHGAGIGIPQSQEKVALFCAVFRQLGAGFAELEVKVDACSVGCGKGQVVIFKIGCLFPVIICRADVS